VDWKWDGSKKVLLLSSQIQQTGQRNTTGEDVRSHTLVWPGGEGGQKGDFVVCMRVSNERQLSR